MAKNNKILGFLQKLGKALMTPVAALPAAALLLRLGQPDIWAWTGTLPNGIPWMSSAGGSIFDNLPLLFAIGIAVGLAEENNGVAGLAATIGYFVLTKVAVSFNKDINMGVLAGIIAGTLASYLYNKYNSIKVPDFLGFFSGKRFVPIVTSLYALVLGVLAGYVWPLLQNGLNAFGNAVASAGALGSFFFGLLNRLLIPFGLHHVFNSLFWFQFGTFKDSSGKIVTGDLNRFFALDPTAGTFMSGFFPIMMFALPAACLAMITAAKKENKKAVAGMLIGIAVTSFLTGITEPIEFTFMFIAPVLYGIHAVLTGTSLAIATALGVKVGFGFSGGLIDFVLNWGISTKPVLLIVMGLIYAVIYYFIFLFFIKKFNLQTPGREEDISDSSEQKSTKSSLEDKAVQILQAIGNKENIEAIDACITRIRLTVKNGEKIDENRLKQLGANGIMKLDNKNYQIIVGTVADPLVTHIKAIMKR